MGTPNVIRELENRFTPARRVSSSTRWLVAGGALASVVVFAVTAALLEDRPTGVDLDVESSVEERPDHRLLLLPLKALAVASSTRGSFLLLLAVGLLFAIRRNDWHPALLVGAAFIGVAVSTTVLKALFDRPAPVDWAAGDLSGESFPSGHMAQAVAVWGIIAIIVAMDRPRRTGQILAAGGVLMIAAAAVSRLVLGAHWLTDVIAGTALGVFWLALAAALAFWIRPGEPAERGSA